MRPLRVLIVDDSAVNRRTLADLLGQMPGVHVVGTAQDGDEALRSTAALTPDLITLDLEMPKMDGFTFLRLLMASRPTPVLVISSHSAKENVFRALELGAIDFIAKPETFLTTQTQSVREQLERMVAMVRQLSPARAHVHRSSTPRDMRSPLAAAEESAGRSKKPRLPSRLMVIGSSTGGPTALLDVFAQLPERSDTCVVVAQHMPERFTRAFAERLDRISRFSVREASDGESLYAEQAVVCPGGKCVEVDFLNGRVLLHIVEPDPRDRYTPSVDRLFRSAARALGSRVIGVVLTGMGEDGSQGVVDIKNASGNVFVESEETAVVFGMPRCALATGAVNEMLPLPMLASRLAGMIATRQDASEDLLMDRGQSVSAKNKSAAPSVPGTADDARQEREEFVRKYLHKGAELTEELIRDNQTLDQRVQTLREENISLHEENAKLRAQLASSDAVRDMLATIETMKQEHQQLLARANEIQRAFAQNEQRQADVERELNDIASLYIAGFQLGSTLSLVRVIKHMCELMEQLVGAHSFVLYLLTEDGRRGIPVGAQGKLPTKLGPVELEEGPLAAACATGIMRVLDLDGPRAPGEPIVTLPIMFAAQAVGVIVVYELLPHKRVWAKVDRELFKLLSVHGATALIAANLYAKEAGPRAALHDVLWSLETERHQQLVAADPDAGGTHE